MAADCSRNLTFSASISLSVLYGVSGTATTIGNALVLWVMYHSPSLKTVSNLLLASLSLADLLVGIIIDPFWILRCLLPPFAYNHPLKIIIDSLWIQTSAATTFSLCVVSLDRYIAIRCVFRYYQIITHKICYLVITLVWLISTMFGITRVFISNPSHLPSLWTSVTVTTILLPMTMIVYCQGLIFNAAREQSVKIAHGNVFNMESVRQRARNRKAAKTVSLVVALFFVSWIPTLVTSFVNLTTSDECTKKEMRAVWLWVELIAFTSSAINPWLYSIRNKEFRQEIRRVLKIV